MIPPPSCPPTLKKHIFPAGLQEQATCYSYAKFWNFQILKAINFIKYYIDLNYKINVIIK